MPHALKLFIRKGTLYIHAEARSHDGVWVFCEPVAVIPPGEPLKVGEKVLGMLHASIDTPVNDPARKLGADFLKLARARSWRELYASSTSFEVEQLGDAIRITRWCFDNSRGPTRGLHPAQNEPPMVVSSDPMEVGAFFISKMTN